VTSILPASIMSGGRPKTTLSECRSIRDGTSRNASARCQRFSVGSFAGPGFGSLESAPSGCKMRYPAVPHPRSRRALGVALRFQSSPTRETAIGACEVSPSFDPRRRVNSPWIKVTLVTSVGVLTTCWPSFVCVLSLNGLKVLRLLQRGPYNEVARVKLPPVLAQEVERHLRSYIVCVLERDVYSAAFIERLRREETPQPVEA